MRDGCHIHDYEPAGKRLAPWFRLHPTEICDSFVYKMMAQVEKGDYPSEPIDGPNLWAIKVGRPPRGVGRRRTVRIAIASTAYWQYWVAANQPWRWEKVAGPIWRQGVCRFRRAHDARDEPEEVFHCQAAVNAVKRLGLRREWAPEWRLG